MESKIDSRRGAEHFRPGRASDWQKHHPYEPSSHAHPQPVPLVSTSDLINPMLRASDLAERGVAVCAPTLPLSEAVALLAAAESGWLPVVEKDKPIGVLTERNVIAALAASKASGLRLPVEQVMSRRFSRVRDDDTLDVLFDSFGARGTVVVDRRGHLVGAIYWRNLANKLSERGLGRVLVKLLQREGHAR